jgi:small-conductance mechanosensitive channel
MDTEAIEGTPIPATQPAGFVLLAPGTIASDYALQSLNKALGQAQDEFEDAVKNAVNTYGGWKYTPLETLIKAVRPSLTKYHLTISQFPVTDLEEKTITVYTRIVHWDSGEWMQNALELPGELALGKDGAPKFNQQTIGGSQTYGQKYAYKAIAGIPDGEEMIDSTDEKGDLPSRQKKQSDVRQAAQQRAGAISHQENAPRATTTQQSAQQAHQRAASAPEAARPQAAQLKFIPPNGLTAVIKGVKEIEALAAKPANGDIPAMKAVRGRLIVSFLGQHNGVEEASCFDTKFWPALKESVGLECHFQIAEKDANGKHYINIEDLIYVAGEEYVDGKPVQGEQQ